MIDKMRICILLLRIQEWAFVNNKLNYENERRNDQKTKILLVTKGKSRLTITKLYSENYNEPYDQLYYSKIQML